MYESEKCKLHAIVTLFYQSVIYFRYRLKLMPKREKSNEENVKIPRVILNAY